MDNVSPSHNLVSELESLGASVLITSRNKVPFTKPHEECRIAASGEDVRAFVHSALQTGSLSHVLELQPALADKVAAEISDHADGM